MTSGEKVLTDRERRALAALCDAFHPSLTSKTGDDSLLFSTAASDLGVPQAAERTISLLPTAERGELRQLLRLLDSVVGGLVIGKLRGVTSMSADERDRLLRALSTHRIGQLRQGFQALKRLSSFLYYSVVDKQGLNPVWPSIGYTPSDRPETGADPLRVVTFDTATTIDCDVCVVGSGAGGGTVAGELAAKGVKTVVLEAGPADQAPQFTQRELDGVQRLYYQSGLAASSDLGVAILAGACIGGGTTVNWQTSLRTPDFIRDEWSERSGCGLFTSDRFSTALEAVCRRIGVSADESEVNANNEPLRRGCEALGYEWRVIERNSRGCDVSQCGYCTFGCRVGGKQSTVATYLHVFQRWRDSTIVAGCRAERVLIDHGRVEGIEATTIGPGGFRERVTVRAPIVVVACGGIESPALLQRSGVSLAQLGRNLYVHPTTAIAGVYAEPVEPWRGPPQTIVSSEFARARGNFGFRLEAAPTHPGLLALAAPWTDALSHRRLMRRCANVSATIALTRDESGGSVRARRDGGVTIEYSPGAAEQDLLRRGIATASRVHVAAGAEEVHTLFASGLRYTRDGPTSIDAFCDRVASESLAPNRCSLFSAHQMGTCRMGRDAKSAVCDETGAVFGVKGLYVADASLFPASSGVNPMITVMALAKCVVDAMLAA